jgi:hypothetical protein
MDKNIFVYTKFVNVYTKITKSDPAIFPRKKAASVVNSVSICTKLSVNHVNLV